MTRRSTGHSPAAGSDRGGAVVKQQGFPTGPASGSGTGVVKPPGAKSASGGALAPRAGGKQKVGKPY